MRYQYEFEELVRKELRLYDHDQFEDNGMQLYVYKFLISSAEVDGFQKAILEFRNNEAVITFMLVDNETCELCK